MKNHAAKAVPRKLCRHLSLSNAAHAQTWPAKPLKLIVPYAAGGSTDQLARAVADNLGRALGQTVLVENKPGGNTIIGAEAAAKRRA